MNFDDRKYLIPKFGKVDPCDIYSDMIRVEWQTEPYPNVDVFYVDGIRFQRFQKPGAVTYCNEYYFKSKYSAYREHDDKTQYELGEVEDGFQDKRQNMRCDSWATVPPFFVLRRKRMPGPLPLTQTPVYGNVSPERLARHGVSNIEIEWEEVPYPHDDEAAIPHHWLAGLMTFPTWRPWI